MYLSSTAQSRQFNGHPYVTLTAPLRHPFHKSRIFLHFPSPSHATFLFHRCFLFSFPFCLSSLFLLYGWWFILPPRCIFLMCFSSWLHVPGGPGGGDSQRANSFLLLCSLLHVISPGTSCGSVQTSPSSLITIFILPSTQNFTRRFFFFLHLLTFLA